MTLAPTYPNIYSDSGSGSDLISGAGPGSASASFIVLVQTGKSIRLRRSGCKVLRCVNALRT
ncbi:hypothetical protein EJ06DRAFT_531873 [Trichodelitschia bisporula]|uniref:Uncharacterized protein n=1 Tax=Trichodelitschia bisporula TaxID=703511 RepID=A0A6G1HS94_9PEZI|nr:hypothetical protein EJ06DRAFT_531873 [Trichodelitschia bisporula]